MAEAKKVVSKKVASSNKATVKAAEKPKKTAAKKVVKEEVIVAGEAAETAVVETETTEIPVEEKKTAKAGKKSEKGIKEAETKTSKIEAQKHRDEEKTEETTKPKQVQKSRTKLERKSKNFRKAAEQIEKDKVYNLAEALELATKTSTVKFDATVELHVRLGVDPRQADQNIRDMVVLPAGTGKTVRVAVFADADGVTAAKKAGADIAGSEEFLQQLDKGTINFDVLIATPAMMPKLGKYARVLGPKGLMPNPKSGTVTADVTKGVSDAKSGRVEYRVDSTGIVHLGVGKVSFGKEKLLDNTRAVLASIKGNKPASVKSSFVKSVFVTTSMGPSISVEISEVN